MESPSAAQGSAAAKPAPASSNAEGGGGSLKFILVLTTIGVLALVTATVILCCTLILPRAQAGEGPLPANKGPEDAGVPPQPPPGAPAPEEDLPGVYPPRPPRIPPEATKPERVFRPEPEFPGIEGPSFPSSPPPASPVGFGDFFGRPDYPQFIFTRFTDSPPPPSPSQEGVGSVDDGGLSPPPPEELPSPPPTGDYEPVVIPEGMVWPGPPAESLSPGDDEAEPDLRPSSPPGPDVPEQPPPPAQGPPEPPPSEAGTGVRERGQADAGRPSRIPAPSRRLVLAADTLPPTEPDQKYYVPRLGVSIVLNGPSSRPSGYTQLYPTDPDGPFCAVVAGAESLAIGGAGTNGEMCQLLLQQASKSVSRLVLQHESESLHRRIARKARESPGVLVEENVTQSVLYSRLFAFCDNRLETLPGIAPTASIAILGQLRPGLRINAKARNEYLLYIVGPRGRAEDKAFEEACKPTYEHVP